MASFARYCIPVGVSMPPVPKGQPSTGGMELPNNTAVAGKVKDSWVHTVLGLKSGWKSFHKYNELRPGGEVAAVVPQGDKVHINKHPAPTYREIYKHLQCNRWNVMDKTVHQSHHSGIRSSFNITMLIIIIALKKKIIVIICKCL